MLKKHKASIKDCTQSGRYYESEAFVVNTYEGKETVLGTNEFYRIELNIR